MTATSTLLSALLVEPADPTGWLVLADCLEEEGRDDQAELLRVRQRLLVADAPGREQDELRLRHLMAAGARPEVPAEVNGAGMRLVLVPPGSFWMGSREGEPGRHPDEGPFHRVSLPEPFYLGQGPVTQRQFEAVMSHNPSHFRPGGEGAAMVSGLDTSEHPVERVSWFDAVEFCRRLGAWPTERSARRRYRLPTEAEWEYACRAGTTTVFHFGDALSSDLANIDGNLPEGEARKGRYLARTTPVGSYPPNAFGLYDMHGNVWEWCADWFDDGYYHVSPESAPAGPEEGHRRSLRGGGWFYGARICRSAYRYRYEPEGRHNDFGLRVVMERG